MENSNDPNLDPSKADTLNETNEQNPPAETESKGTEISEPDETKEEKKTETKPKYSSLIGIFLCVLASLSVVVGRTIFIYFKDLDIFVMNVYTTFFSIVFAVPFNCIFLQKNDFTVAKNRKLILFILGIFSGFSTITARIPLMYIPYGTATTIYYIRPTLVMFAAFLLINEKLGWTRVSLAILTLVGVIVVVEPPFIFTYKAGNADAPAWAYGIAFSQPVINTATVIIMRVTRDVHFVISSTTCAIITTILCICLLPLADEIEVPGRLILWLAIVAVGCLTGLAGILVVLAHHFCDAGVLSTVLSLELVFSFMAQIIIFNQIPSYVSIVGACIVLLCVSGIGLSEYFASKNKKEETKADRHLPSMQELPLEDLVEA